MTTQKKRRRQKPKLWLLSSLIFVMMCWGCPASETKDILDPRTEFLEDLTRNQIIPIYEELAVLTSTLASSAQNFCSEQSEVNLRAVQNAWEASRRTWKKSEVFAFGPVKEYPWRIGPKIDLWPVRPEEIERTLEKKPWKDTNDLSLATGFSVGFPAIEYLIYSVETSTSSVLTRFLESTDRCVYLTLLAKDLEQKTKSLSQAWLPGGDNFADEVISPNRDRTFFKDINSAFEEVTNRIGYTVENMREIKIAKPAGYGNRVSDLSLLESRISGTSIQDLQMNLEGIKIVYKGEYMSGSGKGLNTLVPNIQSSVDESVLNGLAFVEAELNSFDSTLEDAIRNQPEQVRKLYDALKSLQRAIQVDLFNLLGITVGFNDTDGD